MTDSLSCEVHQLINSLHLTQTKREILEAITYDLACELGNNFPVLHSSCVIEAAEKFEEEISDDVDLFHPIVMQLIHDNVVMGG